MHIHAVTRPGFYPVEPVIREMERGIDVIVTYPAVGKVAEHFVKQNESEGNSEVNQRRNIDRREKTLHSMLKHGRLLRDVHAWFGYRHTQDQVLLNCGNV